MSLRMFSIRGDANSEIPGYWPRALDTIEAISALRSKRMSCREFRYQTLEKEETTTVYQDNGVQPMMGVRISMEPMRKLRSPYGFKSLAVRHHHRSKARNANEWKESADVTIENDLDCTCNDWYYASTYSKHLCLPKYLNIPPRFVNRGLLQPVIFLDSTAMKMVRQVLSETEVTTGILCSLDLHTPAQ